MKRDIPKAVFAIFMWIPFAFCALLCAMALWVKFETDSMGVADPAFFCFLPMTFFFFAMVVWQIYKVTGTLTQRIEHLEAQTKQAKEQT